MLTQKKIWVGFSSLLIEVFKTTNIVVIFVFLLNIISTLARLMYFHLTMPINIERYSILFIDLKDRNTELVLVEKNN